MAYLKCLALFTCILVQKASARLIGRRGSQDQQFANAKGAILAVNGQPTSCEVGLLGLNGGFVAANCLEYVSDNAIDSRSTYELYIYNGTSSNKPSVYGIEYINIKTVQNFDNVTLSNNLAVLDFQADLGDAYKSYISLGAYSISSGSYDSRMVEPESGLWSAPELIQQDDGIEDQCNEYGSLYKSNPGWMTCTNLTTTSVYNSSCVVPYSALYRAQGDDIALVALYSHSIILGTDECASPRISYYTRLEKYLAYAAWRFDKPIDIYNGSEKTTYSLSGTDYPNITMQTGTYVNMTDKLLVGGNLYARYQETETSLSSTLASPTATPTETVFNKNEFDGGKTTKVVVSCVVVGVVAIGAAIGFFVYWKLGKRKVRREWDPHGESMNIYAVAHNLNTDVAHVLPPSYAQLEARNRIEQATPAYIPAS